MGLMTRTIYRKQWFMLMDLSTASQWAEVIGLVTILGAAIYSWFQINELKKSREGVASLSLAELFQDTEFSHGGILIFRQPDDLKSIEEMEAFHGSDWPKVFTVLTTWESIGVLMHEGHLDWQIVHKLYSGSIIRSWEKTEKIIYTIREATGIESAFEWVQWIAERMIEFNEQYNNEPAQFAYKDWRPTLRKAP